MTTVSVSPITRDAQDTASDPRMSVFVAANAGSGKTHVLTQRVVRLLLAGVPPSRILCLTYTKAAAAEMQARVFGRLSKWTRMSEEELKAALAVLGRPRADAAEIAEARRLFARALETPGGLKIQTIHAFCEAILHQFPLEANVPGHFEVLDEAESQMLVAEARRLLLRRTREVPPAEDAALAEAFAEALALGGEWGLDGLVTEIVSKRDRLRAHLEEAGGLDGAVDTLRRALGLKPGDSEESVLASLWPCPHFGPADVAALMAAARASSSDGDAKLLDRLTVFCDGAASATARFDAYRAAVLDSKGQVRASIRGFATKTVAAVVPGVEERLRAAGERALALLDRLATLRLFRASRAALVIAERLEADYQALKRRRGRLDFEDLVVRTADLLTRAEASAWVHYKLDRGIDHVLVDEAQDTSPRQWEVVRALVDEFFTGDPATGRGRTVFAVGDEKQSIYSFQGASPAMFAEERAAMEKRAKAARLTFERVELHQSFRSAPDILMAVDHVFEAEADRRGLSADAARPVHSSARGRAAGLVEIWPFLVAEKARVSEHWLDPIDHQPQSAPANRLARRIAAQIAGWIGTPVETKDGTRPLDAGDFIVLVRKRSGFVGSMGAALRERGIRVAGADRLVITDHIAVQDLMALGRVVANSQDELSLASLLKSPLFGFSDDELMALALSRRPEAPEALYFALRRLASADGAAHLPDFVTGADRERLSALAARAFDRIESLRDRAGFEGVFTFFARILGPEGGRAQLVARLGREAGEVIDAFLDLALAHEGQGTAGLDGFLADLSASPPTIKREMDHGRGEVRIMTAHAAKGLEAPVVFLVDPGSAPFVHSHGAKLIEWEGMPGLAPHARPGWLWCPEKPLVNGVVEELRLREKEQAEDEYRRLLYVGMTRAADRLVVCGFAGSRGPHGDCWLSRVSASLRPRCTEIPGEDGETIAYRFGTPAETATSAAAAALPDSPVRAIDLTPLEPERLPPPPLAPSSASTHPIDGAEDGSAGEDARAPAPGLAVEMSRRVRRGQIVHRLLQVLPDMDPAAREGAARAYAERLAADFDAPAREAMLASVFRILDDPAFGPIFAPGSRAEVAVTGRVTLGGRDYAVNGTVDRLAVSAGEILIVDYKSNRPFPETIEAAPEAYLLQLALYRELLAPLYPGRRIRAALLFTEGPLLVPVPAAAMDAALVRRAARAGRAA